MTRIEPGWYRDPAEPQTQRYWDGEQWIGKSVDVDATPPDEPEPLPEPEPEPEPAAKAAAKPASARNSLRPEAAAIAMGRPLTQRKIDRLLAGRTLAHPGLRFVARLIDILLVGVLNAVVNGYFIYQYFQEIMPTVRSAMANPNVNSMDIEFSDRAYQLQVLILIISILLWFAYEVPSTVNSGQTLGKRAMHIKVVPIYATRLRYGSVMSRWSLLMLPLACFPVGVIIAIVDGLWCLNDRPFRQCLHDKSPGTMVVVTGNDPSQSERGNLDVPSDSR